ncbi:unnamed protein product [Dracunculus medinensis]|uniref:7TM_GPCR_Srx domain-containing protein n=1 Tax=Dracunculus medinensis TaxID=318479 RepID=A0A0N4UI89_DRAME|nr:unnamed protein product [Dracunculus medinensis]
MIVVGVEQFLPLHHISISFYCAFAIAVIVANDTFCGELIVYKQKWFNASNARTIYSKKANGLKHCLEICCGISSKLFFNFCLAIVFLESWKLTATFKSACSSAKQKIVQVFSSLADFCLSPIHPQITEIYSTQQLCTNNLLSLHNSLNHYRFSNYH